MYITHWLNTSSVTNRRKAKKTEEKHNHCCKEVEGFAYTKSWRAQSGSDDVINKESTEGLQLYYKHLRILSKC